MIHWTYNGIRNNKHHELLYINVFIKIMRENIHNIKSLETVMQNVMM